MSPQQFLAAEPLMRKREKLKAKLDELATDTDMIVQYGAEFLKIKSEHDDYTYDLSLLSEESRCVLMNGIAGAIHREIIILDEQIDKI